MDSHREVARVITATMNTFNAAAFNRDLLRACDLAIEATAQQVPLDLSRRIYARVDPDGQTQRPNSPPTSRYKRRVLGHDVPLLYSGTLSTPQRYSVRRVADAYHISPPIGRAVALESLESRGYRIWGISREVAAYAERALERGLAWMESRLSGGVYGG